MNIQFVALDENRTNEAILIAHGLGQRSVQEWFNGDEFPNESEIEKLGATLRLLNSAWVLVR